MKSDIRILCVALVFLCGCAHQSPEILRVISYNIHHGEGLDGKLDVERIARIIQQSNADLASIQEVDRHTQRTQQVDEPARLGELTGMHAVFEKNIDYEGGEYGNVILSRWPVESYENHHLPLIKATEQRGMLVAHINAGGKHIVFCATHFDASRPPDDRKAAAAEVKQFLEAHTHWPIILAGDLNAKPDNPVLSDVFSVMFDTCPADVTALTVPADQPKARIDYILFNHYPGIRVVDYRVITDTIASDHRPVLATLSIP